MLYYSLLAGRICSGQVWPTDQNIWRYLAERDKSHMAHLCIEYRYALKKNLGLQYSATTW
jgi:hypothetical protein